MEWCNEGGDEREGVLKRMAEGGSRQDPPTPCRSARPLLHAPSSRPGRRQNLAGAGGHARGAPHKCGGGEPDNGGGQVVVVVVGHARGECERASVYQDVPGIFLSVFDEWSCLMASMCISCAHFSAHILEIPGVSFLCILWLHVRIASPPFTLLDTPPPSRDLFLPHPGPQDA